MFRLVINTLYEAGLQNDKLNLLFLENNNAQVAVKMHERISHKLYGYYHYHLRVVTGARESIHFKVV